MKEEEEEEERSIFISILWMSPMQEEGVRRADGQGNRAGRGAPTPSKLTSNRDGGGRGGEEERKTKRKGGTAAEREGEREMGKVS